MEAFYANLNNYDTKISVKSHFMGKNLKHSKSKKKLKIGGPALTECVFVTHEILGEKM
jgi:hypothetical protein